MTSFHVYKKNIEEKQIHCGVFFPKGDSVINGFTGKGHCKYQLCWNTHSYHTHTPYSHTIHIPYSSDTPQSRFLKPHKWGWGWGDSSSDEVHNPHLSTHLI